MPLYPVQKAIGGQQALLDEYLPNAERNIFGGKVTLRDMLDFVRGKTAEEQVAGFAGPAINPALPMAVGMYVKPRWGETGSFSALWDRKPRVEISDELMKFKQPLERKVYQNVRLGDIVEHPELFAREPELANLKTTIDFTRESAKPWSEGSFNAQYIGIPNSSRSPIEAVGSSEPNILKTLSHEIQHAVQHQSEFATGGNPGQFTDEWMKELEKKASAVYPQRKILIDEYEHLKKLRDNLYNEYGGIKGLVENDKLGHYTLLNERINNNLSEQAKIDAIISTKTPFQRYRNIAGEVEARDTANRMLMNLEQRRKRMPYAGQGIPLEEMIVR